MLRKNVTTAARPVIANLIRRGVGLEAIDDTPLDDLSVASAPIVTDELVEIVSDATADGTAAILEAVEETSMVSPSHELIIDGLVSQGAAQMEKTIDKARNVVVPAIAATVDSVVKSVDRALTPSNDVREFKIHPLAASVTVSELFSQYKDAVPTLSFIPDLPTLTGEQLKVLLETGSAETNAQIIDFLSGYPDGYIDELVNDLIRGSLAHGEEVSNGYMRLVDFSGATPYIRRNVFALPPLAVACIILNNLHDNPPANTPVSIDFWNETVATAQAGLGAMYHLLLNDIAQHIASGRLDLPTTLRQGVPVAPNEFPILDRVYNTFLERDGFPELLFATTLPGYSGGREMDDVLAHSEELNAAWSRQVESFRQGALSRLSNTARNVAYTELGKLVNSLDLSELGTSPEQIWDGLKDYAENVEFTADTLYEHIRFLIAGVLYARYQTLDLLVATDKYMLENPGCNPRVAAYHGAKAYICQWVADQMLRR